MVSRLVKASIMARRERAFSMEKGTFNMNLFKGYGTYIVAVMVMLIALVEGPLGLDLPGVDIGGNWLDYMMSGAFGVTFRRALGNLFPN